MGKYIKLPFAIGLAVWFTTAVYLSINSIIGFFIETDPYIAKALLSLSFIWIVGFAFYNYKKNGDVVDPAMKGENGLPRPGCKTCKAKK